MVVINLIPRRGNSAKYFPHFGFLGLSPVIVTGLVQVDLAPDGCEEVASQLSVRLRCYEEASVHQFVPGHHNEKNNIDSKRTTVVWETSEVVWNASQAGCISGIACSAAKLGRFEANWRLVIPVAVAEKSAKEFPVGSMTYKDWRTWWQVEAGSF